MGPTKAVVRGDGLFEARSGKLIYRQVSTGPELAEYAGRHYVVLPEVDKAGEPWELDGSRCTVFMVHAMKRWTISRAMWPAAPIAAEWRFGWRN